MTGAPAVARVCVDSPLPHLDRLFDYAVPDRLRDRVGEGTRVRVPFAGRLISAVVCEVAASSDFEGRLAEVRSAALLPSYTPEALELARTVADRYGGSRWDVLRLMAPPRAAAVEKRAAARVAAPPEPVSRSRGPRTPAREVWAALPDAARGVLPAAALADRVGEARARGGVIVAVPDHRALAALLAALEGRGLRRWSPRAHGEVAVLHGDEPPAARYGAYLAAMHGEVDVVVGNRSAVWQPLPRLAMIALWDDGSTAFQEPHAPYPHARTVAALRSEREGADLLLAAWQPSVEAAALVAHGWARLSQGAPSSRREAVPAVEVLDESRREAEGASGWHWMPSAALRTLREGVLRGPVFALVPRAGYAQALACARCAAWAVCRDCGGALAQRGPSSPPDCVECGREHDAWHCPDCHGASLSRLRLGAAAVAEQLARMLPGVAVRLSSAEAGALPDGQVSQGLVVATPSALPAVAGGYAAGVVVGADGGLGASGTEVDAARLWSQAAALVRPRADGGRLVLVGSVPAAVTRALQSWSGADLAEGVRAERASLGLPPETRVVEVRGAPPWIGRALDEARREQARVADAAHGFTALVARGRTAALVGRLRALQAEASAAGEGSLRMRVDGPLESLR